MRQLRQPFILPISIMFWPDKGADALEQCRARRRQLRVSLRDTSDQAKRQRITVKILEAVGLEVIEHMINIQARVLCKQNRPRFTTIERFERQDSRLSTVEPTQIRHATRLPFSRSTREDERR
ncbi:hypothetical protein D3C85_1179590 [compost metagenome]